MVLPEVYIRNFPVSGEDEALHYEESDLGIFLVADGLTGYHGANASNTATDFMRQNLKLRKAQITNTPGEYERIRKELLIDLLGVVNKKLHEEEKGTTIDALIAKGMTAHFAHVGDGRIYVAKQDGTVTQLTEDESVRKDEFSSDRSAPKNFLGKEPELKIKQCQTISLDGVRYLLLTTDGLFNAVLDEEVRAALKHDHPLTTINELEALLREPQKKLDLLMQKRPEFAAEVRKIVESSTWSGPEIEEARKRAHEGMRIIEPARAYMEKDDGFKDAIRSALVPLMDKDDTTFMLVDFSSATQRLMQSETHAREEVDERNVALRRIYVDTFSRQPSDAMRPEQYAEDIVDGTRSAISAKEQEGQRALQETQETHRREIAEKDKKIGEDERTIDDLTTKVGKARSALVGVYERITGKNRETVEKRTPEYIGKEAVRAYDETKKGQEEEISGLKGRLTALYKNLRTTIQEITGSEISAEDVEKKATSLISGLIQTYRKKVVGETEPLNRQIRELQGSDSTSAETIRQRDEDIRRLTKHQEQTQARMNGLAEEIRRQYNILFEPKVAQEVVDKDPSHYFGDVVEKVNELKRAEEERSIDLIERLYARLEIPVDESITSTSRQRHIETILKNIGTLKQKKNEIYEKYQMVLVTLEQRERRIQSLEGALGTLFSHIKDTCDAVGLETDEQVFQARAHEYLQQIGRAGREQKARIKKLEDEVTKIKKTREYRVGRWQKILVGATTATAVILGGLFAADRYYGTHGTAIKESEPKPQYAADIQKECDKAERAIGRYIAVDECKAPPTKEALEAIQQKEKRAALTNIAALQIQKGYFGTKEKPLYCVKDERTGKVVIITEEGEKGKTENRRKDIDNVQNCEAFKREYSWIEVAVTDEDEGTNGGVDLKSIAGIEAFIVNDTIYRRQADAFVAADGTQLSWKAEDRVRYSYSAIPLEIRTMNGIARMDDDGRIEITKEGQQMLPQDLFTFLCLRIIEEKEGDEKRAIQTEDGKGGYYYQSIENGKLTYRPVTLKGIKLILGQKDSPQCNAGLPREEPTLTTPPITSAPAPVSQPTPSATVETPKKESPKPKPVDLNGKRLVDVRAGEDNKCFFDADGKLYFKHESGSWWDINEWYVLATANKPANSVPTYCGVPLSEFIHIGAQVKCGRNSEVDIISIPLGYASRYVGDTEPGHRNDGVYRIKGKAKMVVYDVITKPTTKDTEWHDCQTGPSKQQPDTPNKEAKKTVENLANLHGLCVRYIPKGGEEITTYRSTDITVRNFNTSGLYLIDTENNRVTQRQIDLKEGNPGPVINCPFELKIDVVLGP
ncbi:MAG: protein phosphatase 2C domain-containing protein [Candidatus Woesearchaeota archaeon]|nr:protein phosphatase 2C domain-containing protein [Candidatus Woesearchaeota archaeon]